jgi:hypothetical protein
MRRCGWTISGGFLRATTLSVKVVQIAWLAAEAEHNPRVRGEPSGAGAFANHYFVRV